MGTNFYLHKKLTKSQKADLYKCAIINDDYDSAVEILEAVKPIHIGKRSLGWKFLWNANQFRYFEPNRKSIVKFLKSGVIKNEYGETFTYEQFMKDEIAGFLKSGYDLETYEKEHTEEKLCWRPRYSELELQPFLTRDIHPNLYGEFYIGKLRFTVCDAFS